MAERNVKDNLSKNLENKLINTDDQALDKDQGSKGNIDNSNEKDEAVESDEDDDNDNDARAKPTSRNFLEIR